MLKSPIEILQEVLTELERSLIKSKDMFAAGTISDELHATHKKTLQPAAREYQVVIHKLLE